MLATFAKGVITDLPEFEVLEEEYADVVVLQVQPRGARTLSMQHVMVGLPFSVPSSEPSSFLSFLEAFLVMYQEL